MITPEFLIIILYVHVYVQAVCSFFVCPLPKRWFFVPEVMVSVCNETNWHIDPLPLRLCGLWFWAEKKSITEVEWAQNSAKPGFMVVIAHISYTSEQQEEARKKIFLVKFKLGNLSEAQRIKTLHAVGELHCLSLDTSMSYSESVTLAYCKANKLYMVNLQGDGEWRSEVTGEVEWCAKGHFREAGSHYAAVWTGIVNCLTSIYIMFCILAHKQL